MAKQHTVEWLNPDRTWDPVSKVRWALVDGIDRRPILAPSAEAAETARAALLAELQAKAEAAAERAAERKRKIDAEAIARAVAKAAATPHFAGSLTFLKLVQYRDTVPYFDEIKAEIDRLQAEADAAAADEEDA